MSIASTVNQQSAAAAASAAGTTGASFASSGGSATAQNALTSLSSNFNDFLSLLTTQLQNQDPSSPMDTNQFTSELVQFSSVEQQINTNASLTQLIQLTQSGDMLNSAAMVGHQVQVTSAQMPLQSGSGTVDFTTPTAEPVTIAVSDANGTIIRSQTLTSAQGANSWSWNGTGDNGVAYPDGAYGVSVTAGSGAAATAVPFTVVGTATGVVNSGGTLDVSLGGLDVGFTSIVSLVK
jgi:flagellar basal-body rod modification protein FlgD